MDNEALVAPVATSLAAWKVLAVELGDGVVVTSGHPLSKLFAVTATWCGAVPVILTGATDADALPGVMTLGGGDPTVDLKTLQKLLERPGAVVVEMSGKAEVVDFIMEAIPPMARLLFVGEAREPLTMDFYVNVHRKGITLHSSTVDRLPDQESIERAKRLLQDPDRLAQVRQAMGADRGTERPAGR